MYQWNGLPKWRYLIPHGLLLCLVSTVICISSLSLGSTGDTSDSGIDQPSIENYATIEAYSNGIPVYAFGYTYVYGSSPDLLTDVLMQKGNTHPIVKIKLKKSWEIASNYCGSTPAREPKTMWNDDQPLLPIHLIDGNPETAWSSRGLQGYRDVSDSGVNDSRSEWIRIDLPTEQQIHAIALVCCSEDSVYPDHVVYHVKNMSRVGRSPPRHVTIKVSRDGREWETVYVNENFSGSDSGANVIPIEPVIAKMIWIIGKGFKRVGNWGPSFSIGEVEVHNGRRDNLAAVTRGAGVQVSTTYYGYGMDRFTQEMLWPIQYDLGFKWTRVGYDMGRYLWSYVEREKGKLLIDAEADRAVTEACNNGVKVILCLDKGNWLYRKPARKTDWKWSRVHEMMETYYDHQGWPHNNDQMMKGYLRYVDYMVRHFKGRVEFFEICNEWKQIGIENYIKILNASIKTIKKADPQAKIMLGSTGGFDRQAMLQCLGAGLPSEIKNGRLEIYGSYIVTVKEFQAKDITVQVDAKSKAECGFVLRGKDKNNYLLAIYSPPHNAIYFHERINGDWGERSDHVPVKELGDDIQLRATVKGDNVVFTVSDGEKELSTTHTIEHFHQAGKAGLFHNVTAKQSYDNFSIADDSGKILFNDDFNQADGEPKQWDMSSSVFVNPEKIGPDIDAVGWHPWYQTDPDSQAYKHYRELVGKFKQQCETLDFQGQYVASEWTWAAPYPGHPEWVTEMTKAKFSAQLMTAHAGMGVVSLYNETFQSGRTEWDCNLLRNSSFQMDPITPSQPQPVYYMLRNISTILDGFEPKKFSVEFTTDENLECYTFEHQDGAKLVAAWIPGRTADGIVQCQTDIVLKGFAVKQAHVFDSLNGTRQQLNIGPDGGDTVLSGMMVKDYPVFIHLR